MSAIVWPPSGNVPLDLVDCATTYNREIARKNEEYVRAFFGLGPAEYLSRREMNFLAAGWALALTPMVFEPPVLDGDVYRLTARWDIGLIPREQTLADMASWGWFGGDL